MRIPGTPTDGVSLTVLADALAPYATISSVNSALNTKLNTTGGAVSGLLSFSGLDSVGVRLKSLTSAQYGNLTPADGDLYLDTTTNRIDARIGGTTREVIDNFGGQQINGNLTASGTITNQGVRLLQSVGGTQRGMLNCPSWSSAYVALQNSTLAETAANCGFNQGPTGETVVNAASGTSLFLRIANSTIGQVTSTGIAVNGELAVSNQGLRLQQSFGGTVRGVLNCPSWDVSFVALRNGTLAETAANTALYQSSNGDTGVNAASGRGVAIAIANAPVVLVNTGSVAVTGNLTATGSVTGNAANATSVAMIARAAASQSANIQEWQNSASALLASIYPAGQLNSQNTTQILLNQGTVVIGRNGGNQLQYGEGAFWQRQVFYTNGGSRFEVSHTGSGTLTTAPGSAVVGSIVRGAASQTANLQEWQNSANTVVASVSPAGNLTSSGTITGGVITGSTSLNTNSISRNTPTATLTLGFGSMPTGFHSVTIGGGGSLTNSSGVSGYLRLNSVVNQTGTAGSTDILVDRIETAMGSGLQNFADFQGAGVSRFRIQNDAGLFWSDVRIQRVTKTFRTECFESTLSAWQETSRQEASATGPRWSVMGATPIVRQTHAAVATDLATAITRLNTLCTHLTNFGLFN